ncbi:beta strand repeat-containing protein [Flavivirga spongiicola]|uniref:Uncharacterized protein n=1 Tax=Flavivirga spongiicola TaxID=421621 RepID=A0ABU7XQT1_9FLAO|nr:hypothetical protein [Flavivirga sp. MEBiC05379]MDO5978126.1 hypothetical protein [Flavivirga sp. MEBiC05379]
MKTKLLFFAFFSIGYISIAQVGVGTPLPNSSAQLDVVASDKGILIPRVSLLSSTDITTISNGNVESLLIFNTSTISDVRPGYYYWHNNIWNRIIIQGESASGVSSGSGAPTGTSPTNPQDGDLYIDNTTGETYVYNSTTGTWDTAPYKVVSGDVGNVVIEDANGLAYLSADAITAAGGVGSGDGPPNDGTDDPANPTDGQIYIDSSTGETYVYDGATNTWNTAKSNVVSANTGNVVIEDANGLAYLSADAIAAAGGVGSGDGPPNDGTDDPANPTDGQIYIDSSTGETYVYDGATNTWNAAKSNVVSANTGNVVIEDANGLAYLSADAIAAAGGVGSGDGPPNDGTDDPANPTDGQIYIDSSTGETYVYDGATNTWNTAKSNVVSADAGNIITEDTNGLAYLSIAGITAAETTSTLTQNDVTGDATYTDEDGLVTTVDVISTDAANIIVAGTDGGALVNPAALAAAETTTTVANTVTGHKIGDYTNEDAVAIDINETVTSVVQSGTGIITYTNEDGTAQTANVISTDAANIIVAGTDGGALVNPAALAAAETTTTVANTVTGHKIGDYTNEDAVAIDINETVTSVVQAGTGIITYTNEDGTAQTANVISTDAANIIVAGTDGGALVNPAALAAAETTTTVANTVTGHKIGDYTNEDAVAIDINETVTSVVQAGTGIITYTNEDGTAQTANVISTDAANIIVAGTDGGALVNPAALAAAETTTNLAQAGTGIITYTNEDGTAQTANVISTDAANIIVAGTDGGALVNPAALAAAETTTTVANTVTGHKIGDYTNEDAVAIDINETVTSVVQAGTGIITYTNEDGTAQTANVISTDAANIIVAGTDGGALVNPAALAAAETTTNLAQSGTGIITYTNEDGTAQTANVISTDAANIIVAGTDGGALVNPVALAAAETTTNLAQSGTGIITYTNEDGTAQTANVISTDAANIIVAGTDGGALVNPAALAAAETTTTVANTVTGHKIGDYTNEDAVAIDINETVTSVVQAGTGIITYTNEDGTAQTANVISTDAANIIVAGTDGGALVNPAALAAAETTTTVANTVTGHKIGDYTNEDAVAIDINETVTSVVQAGTGIITYTNEDGTAQTANVISTDAANIIVAGTDGGALVNPAALAAAETTTNLAQAGTGIITYTNEDGTAQTANVISTDAANIIVAGTDGGALVNPAALAAAETTTNLAQSGTGIITYTNEDGTAQTANVISTDAANIIVAGTDGGALVNPAALAAAETTTNLAQSGTGIITYTNEDGTAQTANVISTDAANIIVAGTDGGALVNPAALAAAETTTTVANTVTGHKIGDYTNEDAVAIDINETVTSVVQSGTGIITYTNEDGTAQTANVISTDAANIIVAGTDGGALVNPAALAAAETTTNLAQAGTGIITYTNEDGTAQTANVISTDAANIIVAGTDGGALVNPAALAAAETTTTVANTVTGHKIGDYTNEDAVAIDINETVTSVVQAGTGIITYTNEDGTAQTANVISTDAANIIVAGTDGGALVNPAALAAAETTTNLAQAGTGIITYTNEDGTAQTANVISTDAANIIVAGTDGGALVNPAALAAAETTTTVANTVTGHKIGDYTNEDAVAIDINETVTSVVQAGTGIITYTNEDGTAQTANVISTDAANIIVAGTDGGALVNPAALAAAETTTTVANTVTGHKIGDYTNEDAVAIDINETVTSVVQAGTGIITYTNEDGTAQTANVISTDAANIIVAGTDGGALVNPAALAAAETTTNLAQSGTGIITYTNEDGTAQTANVISTDAANIIVAGTDGGALVNPAALAAAETTTNLAQSGTGIITYTNEDGTAQTANVISTDAANIIVAGTDGGALVNPAALAAAETTTNLAQAGTGIITYTNEDGTAQTANVISTDAANIIVAGTDGGALVNPAALAAAETTTTVANTVTGHKIGDYTNEDAVAIDINETVTSVTQNNTTGVITYTNENGVTDNTVNAGELLNVVSVEPTNGNAIKIGTDGGAYINPLVTEVFSAEYAGATLFADGSNNIGMMTSDNAGASGSWMNYYEWSSGEATAQDYDVVVRFTLPNDFTAWDTNPIVIDYQAEGAATFGATMFLENGAALGTIAATTSGAWTTANLSPGAMTAGQTAVIVLKLTSAPNDDTKKVRIGDITLNYKK